MKVVVLNGSPKGENSVTMQYVAFLQHMFCQHEFILHHVAREVDRLEKDEQALNKVVDDIASADGVLWAFPLYVFLVHGKYKRFIELLHERAVTSVLEGKTAAIFSTSIHFFDHTAHNYMHGICDDFDMKVYGSYSAAMHDLFVESERENLLHFGEGFFKAMETKTVTAKVYPPLVEHSKVYKPVKEPLKVDACGKKVVVVTDAEARQENVIRMVEQFVGHFNGDVTVTNLHTVDIKGGCLGCIRCGYDNTCVYSGKDGFIEWYNSTIKTADIVVFAGTIRDRYLSSLWKTFFDRAFFNTHMPSLKDKQIAFIISGPLEQLPNLRQIFEGYTEWQNANLVGIVTDEPAEPGQIDELLQALAERSVDCANRHYISPSTFLGVGGRKIFRDEIWGHLRFPFVADHKYYKKNGIYDFPSRNYVSILMSILVKIPAIRNALYGRLLITKMIEPYKKLLEKQKTQRKEQG